MKTEEIIALEEQYIAPTYVRPPVVFDRGSGAYVYDLEGRLVGAPYMKDVEGFEPGNCRLDAVKLGIWRGWVFVNLDRDCEPLEDFVADFEADFGFMRQDRMKIFGKFETTLNCNWKLVVENAMDK